jgi:hypothetical protein
MITRIALNIAHQAISNGNVDTDLSWLDAEKLLSEIEKAGMLPPTIKLPAFGIQDNAWEPEDV